jgi:predicted protein tyrosine phosphatase
MKFFSKSKDSGQSKQMVLFICIENAGRSQMAEGFFKKYAPENYEPISAGTKPVNNINPLVMDVMKEVDIKTTTLSQETRLKIAELKRLVYRYPQYYYASILNSSSLTLIVVVTNQFRTKNRL